MNNRCGSALLVAASTLLLSSISIAEDDVALVTDGQSVDFLSETVAGYGAFTLKIAAPDGRIWQGVYTGQNLPVINLAGVFEGDMPDGQYQYEIQPHLERVGDAVAPEYRGLELRDDPPPNPQIGTFTVARGSVIDPNMPEETSRSGHTASVDSPKQGTQSSQDPSLMTQVINDELSVLGSICAGLSCGNNEPFDMESIKLHENNTRISFIDSSATGNFPAGSWELRANDSNEGGADHFSIDWLGESANTGGNPLSTPFRVDASAPTNALRITSIGRIGIGTSMPGRNMHIASPNSPTIRLEQNTVGGFSPQSWDIAGNEQALYVRDITNANRIPFRISQGAPANSLNVAENGNLGVGTSSPGTNLHIKNGSGTVADRNLLTLENDGGSGIHFLNNAESATGVDGRSWVASTGTDGFQINRNSSGQKEFDLLNNGNLAIAGKLTEGGSRRIKGDFQVIPGEELLTAVKGLKFREWSYTSVPDTRHFGPMAEEFFDVFGLGTGSQYIAPGDMAGVAMAAAQALTEENANLRKQLDEMQAVLQHFERRLESIERQR